jgi:hypothetical protein
MEAKHYLVATESLLDTHDPREKAMSIRKKSLGNWARVPAATLLAVLSLPLMATGPLRAGSLQSGDDGRGVLRYDPMSGQLVPVAPEELKVGRLYSHFSKRLNKRVWSYVQDNGEFWRALGEGTTQEGWRLDIRATAGEQMKKLEELAPKLYKKLQEQGERTVYARLTGDGRWVIAEAARFPTFYDAETGRRWERHAGQYIPVSSGAWSYHWAVQDDRYIPLGQFPWTAHGIGRVAPATRGACHCR